MSKDSGGGSSSGGVSFFSLLGLLFIGLKLTHYIDWSWWWVLAPFWGGLAVAAAILVVVAVLALLGIAIDAVTGRLR